MQMRYNNQTVMYDDTEEKPASHHSAPLDTIPTTHSILGLDGETATGYSEDTNPQRDLVKLQDHFKELWERFTQLVPTPNPLRH